MLRYKISERAERDMQSVRHWYDQIGRTLGDRVIDAVYDVIRLARERPTSFPEISEGTRVARCRRFPYRVYFVGHRRPRERTCGLPYRARARTVG